MAENNTILEKLDGLVARFEEVSTLITDPNVISDQKRYVKLTKEYKELGDLMQARKEYLQCLNGLEEAKMMMAENDPEMKEMAREELSAAEKRIPEIAKLVFHNWKKRLSFCWFQLIRKMIAMLFWKYEVVQEEMKPLFSQGTYSVCTQNIANRKAGNWKYLVQTKELPEVLRKLFVR